MVNHRDAGDNPQEDAMVSNTGYFTAENLAAVLRALPETDGTYAEVVKRARDYEADVSRYLLGKWVATGRRDRKAGQRTTAFARFADHFDRLKAEHCTADANRRREYERALQILERTCECGHEKMVLPDGSLADSCRRCNDMEEQEPQRKGSRRSTARRRD